LGLFPALRPAHHPFHCWWTVLLPSLIPVSLLEEKSTRYHPFHCWRKAVTGPPDPS